MKVLSLSVLHAGRIYPPRKYSWYLFLLEADSTPGLLCGRKDYVNERSQFPHRESNPQPSGLYCATSYFNWDISKYSIYIKHIQCLCYILYVTINSCTCITNSILCMWFCFVLHISLHTSAYLSHIQGNIHKEEQDVYQHKYIFHSNIFIYVFIHIFL